MDNVVGRRGPPGSPGLPGDKGDQGDQGIQGPPGGGGDLFVYREGELDPGGNVFATFAGAYAAAFALNTPATIFIDDALSQCEIPPNAGDFDLHQITLSGYSTGIVAPFNILFVNDGVTWNEGFARITGGLWVICNFNTQPFLGVLNQQANYFFVVDGDSVLGVDNEGALFDLSATSPTVYLTLGNGAMCQSNGGCGPTFFTGSSNPTINVSMGENTAIDDGFVSGSSGNLNVNVYSAAVSLPSEFSLFTGDVSVSFNVTSAAISPYSGGGSFPDPNMIFPSIQIGTMYYDTGSSLPYWWNGSTWASVGGSVTTISGVTLNGGAAAGYLFTATSGSTATWQLPTLDGNVFLTGAPEAGDIPSYVGGITAQWRTPTLDGNVILSGGPPSTGQVPVATSGSTATWQTFTTVPNLFIYRSGATPAGNVYDTFDAAYAAAFAAAALGVNVTIGIDDTGGPCTTTPGNNYDLSQITLTGGFGPGQSTLDISNSTISGGFSLKRNLILNTTAGGVTAGFAGTFNARLEDNCQITTTATNFWSFASGTLNIYLGNQCAISGDGLFYAPNAGTINIYYQGTPSTINTAMAFNYGNPAVILNNYVIAGSTPLTTFVNYQGTPNFFFETPAANLNPYTGTGSLPDPGVNPNVRIGTMYFDQTGNAPAWWNGSAWVPAYTAPPARSFMHGSVSQQTQNLSTGDHVTFNQTFNSSGSNITLDESSPYTSGLSQASIGRILLAANHVYKLVASLTQVQSTGGSVFIQWFDTNGGVPIGAGARIQAVSGDNDAPAQVVAYVTTFATFVVELQLVFAAGLVSIGENGAANLYPWFTAEEIA